VAPLPLALSAFLAVVMVVHFAVARVILRNRDGRVVYADDHSLIGQTGAPSGVRAALDGAIPSDVIAAPPGGGGQVLQLFVPLRFGSAPAVGSAEIWLPYAPIAAQISSQSHQIDFALAVGLLLLWGVLLGVVAAASERLRRQAAEKEELALSDGLTGLPNRTMFQSLVHETIANAGRRKRVAAVMLMDLDRFKEVNDTLGHRAGDLLLRLTGQRIGEVLRDSDTVARLGGDEFSVVLPSTDVTGAVEAARRILERVNNPAEIGKNTIDVATGI